MADSAPLADANDPTHAKGGLASPLRIAIFGSALCIAALLFHLTAPPQMVTSVLLNEKSAMTSSMGGLQLGERLAELGVSDLYLVLEFQEEDKAEEYQTEVIEVAQVGNGVSFDVPDDLISYEKLQRITVLDDDLISDDIYDSIDVTLEEPFIGSVYQFRINRTHPRQLLVTVLWGAGIGLLILGVIRYFRLIAR